MTSIKPFKDNIKRRSLINRCIQSKVSGDNFDCRRVELSGNVTVTRGTWASNNYIARVRQEVRSVGEKMLEWEPCPSRTWASRTPVEHHRRTGKKCCYSQKSRGGVNMLQFCLISNLPLTDNTFCNPYKRFRIKWEVYFSKKECVHSSLSYLPTPPLGQDMTQDQF